MEYQDPNTAHDPVAGSDPFADQINALYQQYYGRNATPEEINSHRGNPGGVAAVEAMLRGPVQKTETAAPGPHPPPSSSPMPPMPGKTLPSSYEPPPAYTPPPKFSYQDFTPPTGQDVLNDPGYKFRLDQGEQALQRSAAARGTLNTGGTLKDILGFGQDLASNEFSNMYGRKAAEYSLGRQNALSTYNTNYQTQYMDPYQINYTSQYQDPFTNNFNLGIQNYAQQRNNRNDAFSQRYQLLSLY